MYFRVSENSVIVSDGAVEVVMTREFFSRMEADAVLTPRWVTEIFEVRGDGVIHYLIDGGSQVEAPPALANRREYCQRASQYKAALEASEALPIEKLGTEEEDWEMLIGEVNRGRGRGFLVRLLTQADTPQVANAFAYLTGVLNNYKGRMPSDLYQAVNLLFLSFPPTDEEKQTLRQLFIDAGFDSSQIQAFT